MSMIPNETLAATSSSPDQVAVQSVRIWDLPTRVFHWALVLCVCGSVVTGMMGGLALPWHFRFGYVAGSLLLFRWVWGFVGGHHSRFAAFVRGMGGVRDHFAKGAPSTAGHNPLGGWSVMAMLTALTLQVGVGLFCDDRVAFSGPLAQFVSEKTVRWLSLYHRGMGKALVLALVALHLAAIAYYSMKKRERLIRPMWTGDKALTASTPASRDGWACRALALCVLALAAAVFYAIARLET